MLFRFIGLILRPFISKKDLCTCECNEGDGTSITFYQFLSLFLKFHFRFFLFSSRFNELRPILYRLIGFMFCL